MELRVLAGELAVCRLAAHSPVPAWATGDFVSVTRTLGELSVACDAAAVPKGVKAERGWRALEVAGPLAFSEIGVLAALATPLAEAEVSLFVISTFDTDYLLVKEDKLETALSVLRAAGHTA